MIFPQTKQNVLSNYKAFTLAELMVAVFILAMVLTSFLNVMVASSTLSVGSNNMSSALTSAQSKAEEIRNSDYSSIVSTYNAQAFNPTEPTGSTGTITVQEIGADVADELLQVDIVMSWQNRDGRAVSTTLTTLISNR